MGLALSRAFQTGYEVIGKNSGDFDACDFKQVSRMIEENKPDIVINTVALLGIDPCEKEPEKALRLNTLYPKFLADLSLERDFLLVHFSTDAVFNDRPEGFCGEQDAPCPLNIYGLTKYGGDCFIQAIAKKYYILRLSILFGETTRETQFVEKMLKKVKEGQKTLKISGDIISSPTYSKDVAGEVKKFVETKQPYGLYHLSNEGRVSLYELMKEIVQNLKLDVKVERGSHKDFPCIGIKNTCTPLRSEKVKALRPWQEAVKEYCSHIRNNYK